MEELYIQLRDIIANLGLFSLVDEDSGQLEAMLNGEDTYPITFPAALINFDETQWENIKTTDEQIGRGTVTLRLAFDCYDDTHEGALQDSYGSERREAVATVHKAVHGTLAVISGRPFIRTSSHSYSVPGRIKIYELDYSYRTLE